MNKPKTSKINKASLSKPKLLLILPLILVVLMLYIYIAFLLFYQTKVYPGVKVGSFTVGGLTLPQAKAYLNNEYARRSNSALTYNYNGKEYALDLSDTSPSSDLDHQLNLAFRLGRSGAVFQDLKNQYLALTGRKALTPEVQFKNSTEMNAKIARLNAQIAKPYSNAIIGLSDPIIITPSQDGQEIDIKQFKKQIELYISLNSPSQGSIPVITVKAPFNTDSAEVAKIALEKVKNQPITLKYQDRQWNIDQATLYSLLNFEGDNSLLQTFQPQQSSGSGLLFESGNIQQQLPVIDKNKLAIYLKNLSDRIDQEPKDARFTATESGNGQIKVSEFQPAQIGQKLNIDQTAQMIVTQLISTTPQEISLPVAIIQPKTTTADVNSFGIKELVGTGVSNFSGSIENRIYNIGLAASRINGTLVPPGETFSFNKTVGDISAATGYKQAYVIKSGRTVLDDGGGVCQVSTTLFRAVLNAGLPVTERSAHAYRVGYYEQGFPPGLDATVFYPSVDFKFKNDTPNYLLIQSQIYGKSLTFNIYGTSDGRIVTMSKPTITNQSPPPPELRQDDPTLARGIVKQVDWSAWGANVSFNRTVKRGDETLIKETWRSNYRPWQAVYLVGTKD